jgi:hypothetical protein
MQGQFDSTRSRSGHDDKGIHMQHISDKALELYVRATNELDKKDGQGALEYIGMVIGLAIMVALGFKIAGANIFSEASSFVSKILDSAQN